MKSYKVKHLFVGVLLVAAAFMTSCNEEHITYDGPEYILFSDTLQTIAIQNNETYYEIPVTATTASKVDRTLAVEVVDEESNAIEGLHYDLESYTAVIKAGERSTSVKIRGHFDKFEDTDSIGVTLRLVTPKEKQWEAYGTETHVVLQKVCPFDLNTFEGYAILTSTFFDQFMPATKHRLLEPIKDLEKENTIILPDFLFDGYDIKITFSDKDPLKPFISMDSQIIGSTQEAFQGNVWGDDKLRAVLTPGATSYFNVCQKYCLQFMNFYVEEVGVVGTFINVVEWISKEEYEYLKKQGY